MSGPYQGRDLSNCGVGRLRVAINCGVLSVKDALSFLLSTTKIISVMEPKQGNSQQYHADLSNW